MDVVGKTCPFCQTPIKPGQQAITCSHCGISHHAECWQSNQGCTTYGCQGNMQVPPASYPAQTIGLPVGNATMHNEQAQNLPENILLLHSFPDAAEILTNAGMSPSSNNTTSFKNKLVSIFRNTTSRNIIIAIFLVLVIIALMPTMLNIAEQLRLQLLSNHNDAPGLVSFIQNNIDNSDKQNNIDLAITLLARLNDKSGRDYLENLLYDNNHSNMRLADAKGLADNNVKLTQLNLLYGLYKSNQNQELEDPLKRLLQLEDSNAVANVLKKDVTNEVEKDQYDFLKIFQAVKDTCPNYLPQIKDLIKKKFIAKLRSLADNKDIDSIDNILTATNNYNVFDTYFTKSISGEIADIRNGKNEENGIDNNISQLNGQANTLNDTINQFSYFSLHAFMVAEDSPNIYEIALPEYNYYLGKIPSSNHAILKTTTISYSSKGWLTINAKRIIDIPIQLKQEYGGFTQNWPVYQEVTDSDIAANNSKIQQLSNLNAQINDLKQQKASIDEKNNNLYETITKQIVNMT